MQFFHHNSIYRICLYSFPLLLWIAISQTCIKKITNFQLRRRQGNLRSETELFWGLHDDFLAFFIVHGWGGMQRGLCVIPYSPLENQGEELSLKLLRLYHSRNYKTDLCLSCLSCKREKREWCQLDYYG